MNEKDLNLLLLQYPLKPSVATEVFDNITSIKYKPLQERLEISSIVSGSSESDDSNCAGRAITHISSSVLSNSQLMVGVVRNNALHLTPLQNQTNQSSVLQMRPLIIRKEEELMPIPINPKDPKDNKEHPMETVIKVEPDADEEGGDLQQIYMKRKENEKAYSTRIQSYTTYVNSLNDELYIPMQFHSQGERFMIYVVHVCVLCISYVYIPMQFHPQGEWFMIYVIHMCVLCISYVY